MSEEKQDDGRIRGRVAALLNKRELVLNVGSKDGVEIGMKFAVLNRAGVGVTDPETGEDLGDLEVAKTVVKVVRMTDKASVARTFRVFPGKSGLADMYLATSAIAGRPARTETLTKGPNTQYLEELDEVDSYVKVGDPVVLTQGDEYLAE